MTIGLVRGSGNRSYLVWGGLLFFGAIMSFLTTGLQRHQMTNGQPEQYLQEWHKKADSRSSNPLPVSRAAYGIHHPALFLALCHPGLCPLRRHGLAPGWRDGGCERRMDCRSLFLPQFHPDQANCTAEPVCLGADRMRNPFRLLNGPATV